MSRAIGGARPWSESAGRVGQRHMPPPPISELTDAPRQSNFRLRASFFAAIIPPPRHQILIQIVALFSSRLSRYMGRSIVIVSSALSIAALLALVLLPTKGRK